MDLRPEVGFVRRQKENHPTKLFEWRSSLLRIAEVATCSFLHCFLGPFQFWQGVSQKALLATAGLLVAVGDRTGLRLGS